MRLAPQIREKREERKEKRYCVACRRRIFRYGFAVRDYVSGGDFLGRTVPK